MDVVKYCPKCGEKNKGNRITCKKCGEDLQNVQKVPDGSVPGFSAPPPEKKKICPVCSKVNSAKSGACSCGADLGSVIAIPADKVEEELKRLQYDNEPQAQTPSSQETEQSPSESEQVRLCDNLDCNHINSASMRFCEKCGALAKPMSRQEAEAEILRRSQEDRKAHAPKPEPQKPKAPKTKVRRKATSARLVSDDGSYSYDVKPGKVTLGRRNEMKDYLQSMGWVGRDHAQLDFADGILTVQDLGSQNHTYVNGKKVRDGEVKELSDGDILGLGDSKRCPDSMAAFFRIELR